MIVRATNADVRISTFKAVSLAAMTMALLCCTGVRAQEIADCRGLHAVAELEHSIRAHNEHIYRMNRKFLEYWYFQEKVPEEVLRQGTLHDVQRLLTHLTNRRAAVLFYGHQSPRFCSWLMWLEDENHPVDELVAEVGPVEKSGQLSVIQHVRTIGDEALEQFDALRGGMRDRGLATSLSAISLTGLEEALTDAGTLLLPDRVAAALDMLGIDTLIVVPVTVLEKGEQFASIGTVPFGALPFGNGLLVDRMSVFIAPGFYAFREEPRASRSNLGRAIVVGDPDGDLPGARQEAESIARQFEVHPLLGKNARLSKFRYSLGAEPHAEFLHFATHGIADGDNPLDDSYLRMHGNEVLTARQISHLKLRGRPVVVMSACQTGHGKDFGVGTIGLARSWQWAGASSVIMSLWDVDDIATRDLMQHFVCLARRLPVDRALQAAMSEAQKSKPDPYYWAGFSIFGLPEKVSVSRSAMRAGLACCGERHSVPDARSH